MSRVFSSKESDLFLVDPFWSATLRLMGHHNEVIRTGEQRNGLYESLAYDVKVTLHDLSIHDDQTCKDYDSIGSSYRQTNENILS